jgi:RNA polymerase sigma-70 factor (ECF subfamily)
MIQKNANQPLSLISTLWSLVFQAHKGPPEEARLARQQLLERYGGAVQRHLRKVLHDPNAADEIVQEFAIQLVHGDLRGADPHRGRFRNFVKGTLYHLISDYRKKQRRWPGPLPGSGDTIADASEQVDSDRQFVESWRDELLARAWAALAKTETRKGQPYYAVLRFRVNHPHLKSPQLASQLAVLLDRPLTAVGIRQLLHRARETFADLLLDEVTQSLENPTPELLLEELVELGLFDYCKPALERRELTV